MEDQIFNFVLIGFALAAVPFIVVSVTSFVMISVVFFIVRNAIGIQQTPPNIVIYAITLILTAFISAPVMSSVYDRVSESGVSISSAADLENLVSDAVVPIRDFLSERTTTEERRFFMNATQQVWGPEHAGQTSETDLIILVPTFITSELTKAFKIGILLYLPFLIVDLVVSAILLALGMMMMSPTIVAVPLKLILFVLVDGWSRIVQGLILSYA